MSRRYKDRLTAQAWPASGCEEPQAAPEQSPKSLSESSSTTLRVGRSGEWMEPAEMLQAVRHHFKEHAVDAEGGLILDLAGLDHLDASALQVLLAADAERRRRSGFLQLINASGNLRKWFEFAGASELLGTANNGPASAGELETVPCARF